MLEIERVVTPVAREMPRDHHLLEPIVRRSPKMGERPVETSDIDILAR